MFIITNRTLSRNRTLRAFGKQPNASGPNELRLAEVTKSGRSWRVKPIRDRLSKNEVKSLKSRFGLDIDINQPWHGSLKIACEVFDRARLGHYTKNLASPNAHYIDVTDVEHVGSDHGYFKGNAVRKNRDLWNIFQEMFRGNVVEHTLQYHADNNSYRF